MDTNLRDKIVIVTGGVKGIGRATVELFAEEGAKVVFIDKDQEKGKVLSGELLDKGTKNLFLYGDLRDEKICKKAIDETIRNYGALDVLVSNAGRNDFLKIEDTSPNQFRKSLEENLVSHYSMTHYSWPHLKKSKGNIVFVGSKDAFGGEGGGTVGYCASKGGLLSLTRGLGTDSCYEKLGIRVNCVIPGIVDTPLTRKVISKNFESLKEGLKEVARIIPSGKIASSRDIANEIVFLASNYLSSQTTGQWRFVDGGYSHLDRTITPQ